MPWNSLQHHTLNFRTWIRTMAKVLSQRLHALPQHVRISTTASPFAALGGPAISLATARHQHYHQGRSVGARSSARHVLTPSNCCSWTHICRYTRSARSAKRMRSANTSHAVAPRFLPYTHHGVRIQTKASLRCRHLPAKAKAMSRAV